jgi:GNAT superfamily N-acetyltransferase
MEIVRISEPVAEGLPELLAAFLAEIGEPVPGADAHERVAAAIDADAIRFFGAREAGRLVGMASLTTAWTTYGGGAPFGILEDAYVVPAWRGKGVIRALVERVLEDAREQGLVSVVGTCSEDDVGMYKSLGLTERLGTMLARVF